MQNDPFSQNSGSPAEAAPGGAKDSASRREWTEFERDLDALGRQLSELRAHSYSLGEHVVANLETRFQEVKARAHDWQRLTERQLEELRGEASRQAGEAQTAYGDARERSKEAARQVWERAEPLRQGARDVGEGLTRAWSELRASFGKAVGRLQSDTSSGPSTPPSPSSSERRDAP
jgi:uncharacterized protein YjbJ (UPF0337 family)